MNFSVDSIAWTIILISLILFTFRTVDEKMIENNFDAEKKVFFISEMLISTPGTPENWNVLNVRQTGLQKKYNGYYKKCYIDSEKANQLMQIDYDKLESIINNYL